MPNPRAARSRVRPRQGLESITSSLQSAGGSGIGITTSPTQAMGSTRTDTVLSSAKQNSDLALWANIIPQLADTVASIHIKRQRKKTAEEEKREAELKAQQDAIDAIHGAALGTRILNEVDAKTKSGEWSAKDAEEYTLTQIEENRTSAAMIRSAGGYASKAMEVANLNDRARVKEANLENFLSMTRQGFKDLHAGYDPDKPDEYIAKRSVIYENRHALDMTGTQINELEMASLEAQAKQYASTDPAKAQALLTLAEQLRPDGSPSLAASASDGYRRLEILRDTINEVTLKESARDTAEAEKTLKESTKDSYLTAMTELVRLDSPAAVKEWAAKNVDGKTDTELKAWLGDYRADFVNAVEKMKDNPNHAGNDVAFADWSMSIQRGTAEWEDIQGDERLNEKQRAHLFGNMKDMTQRAQLGYLSDAQLAAKLLTELEEAWPDSAYGTPWTASKQIEPGKPPIIAPEGLYYQGELLKRLRELDPKMEVNKSNREKLEILQEIKNAVLTRKIKWADNVGTLQEPVPELKLSEKVKEGEKLSDPEVSTLGKTLNDGGTARIKDVHNVDYFALDGQEQQRIAAEAQRQKAELEALKSEGIFNKFLDNIGTLYSDGSMIITP